MANLRRDKFLERKGRSRIPKVPTFKTRLCTKPLLWKLVIERFSLDCRKGLVLVLVLVLLRPLVG